MTGQKLKSATKNFLQESFKDGIHSWIAWGFRIVLTGATIWLFNTVRLIPSTINNVKTIPQLESRIKALEQFNHDKAIIDSMRKALRQRTEENEKRLK
jgi:hypothetical protein